MPLKRSSRGEPCFVRQQPHDDCGDLFGVIRGDGAACPVMIQRLGCAAHRSGDDRHASPLRFDQYIGQSLETGGEQKQRHSLKRKPNVALGAGEDQPVTQLQRRRECARLAEHGAVADHYEPRRSVAPCHRRGCADPLDAARDQRPLRTAGVRQRISACADQRERGLVVVAVGWLDDCDIKLASFRILAQLGRDGDARGAAAYDENLMMLLCRHDSPRVLSCSRSPSDLSGSRKDRLSAGFVRLGRHSLWPVGVTCYNQMPFGTANATRLTPEST